VNKNGVFIVPGILHVEMHKFACMCEMI